MFKVSLGRLNRIFTVANSLLFLAILVMTILFVPKLF